MRCFNVNDASQRGVLPLSDVSLESHTSNPFFKHMIVLHIPVSEKRGLFGRSEQTKYRMIQLTASTKSEKVHFDGNPKL